MGVPSFFRWIHKKYPKICTTVLEQQPTTLPDGSIEPVDISQPNPNAWECDNLYLDMNGIVHPCCHPEDGPAPANETEMMNAIFAYIDRIVAMIRPRKLLYMAIDGVAPRAKMNQQRSRRFRAAQEAELYREASIRNDGDAGRDQKVEGLLAKEHFDSNVITPGTAFMLHLADALRFYINQRLSNVEGWSQLQVILSDASVAGEGEHKIMQYIRLQRLSISHDPNTKHVLYGLDADLIMLGLATHEPHFRVLREDVFASDNNCRKCGQSGHFAAQCQGVTDAGQVGRIDTPKLKPYIFLHLNILREYLERDLKPHRPLSFPWNLERAIDDWVFLCFFVGNDFLPHMPSLEIREGAIDRLVRLWRAHLWRFGDYITRSGDVDLQKIELLMNDLGQSEDEIFQRRHQHEERMSKQAEARAESSEHATTLFTAVPVVGRSRQTLQKQFGDEYFVPKSVKAVDNQNAAHALKLMLADDSSSSSSSSEAESEGLNIPDTEGNESESVGAKRRVIDIDENQADPFGRTTCTVKNKRTTVGESQVENTLPDRSSSVKEGRKIDPVVPSNATSDSIQGCKRSLADVYDGDTEDALKDATDTALDVEQVGALKKKSKSKEVDVDESARVTAVETNKARAGSQEDAVRLFEKGWKERYYSLKFGWSLEDIDNRRDLVREYVKGLVWVLKYYYQGCVSWKWYFPYHYAPFASDFTFGRLSAYTLTFETGLPFKPFEQLMAVFPAASQSHIPKPFSALMTNEDSPILDFYPIDFKIDLNGKKHAWQGVALLPFIDEERLLKALAPQYPLLTDEEKSRNAPGADEMFISDKHPSFESLCSLYSSKTSKALALRPARYGLSGSVRPSSDATMPGMTYYVPESLGSASFEDITDIRAIAVQYEGPVPLQPFHTSLLPGVRMPAKVLTNEDVDGGGQRNQHRRPHQHHRHGHIISQHQIPRQQQNYGSHQGLSYAQNPLPAQHVYPPYDSHRQQMQAYYPPYYQQPHNSSNKRP